MKSRIGVLKEELGDLRIRRLEQPDDINRFKSESDYASEVMISTLNKVLGTLRTAINWGMAPRPPWLERTPFHRFGVRINRKAGC